MRHFPYGKALLLLALATAFFTSSLFTADTDLTLTYFLRGIGLVFLLLVFELRLTEVLINQSAGVLEVLHHRWWWPQGKSIS